MKDEEIYRRANVAMAIALIIGAAGMLCLGIYNTFAGEKPLVCVTYMAVSAFWLLMGRTILRTSKRIKEMNDE